MAGELDLRMVREVFPNVIQVRDWGVCFYLLREKDNLALIDGGFLWGARKLSCWLERQGLGWIAVKAILMTHGHLDHVLNVAKIRELSGAKVFGHPFEHGHFRGVGEYRGWGKICGWSEAVGRSLLGYKPFEVDEEIEDGELLDFWGGLRVAHLPGHTPGHCGFYSEKRGVLFSGDSHASYLWGAVMPPRIFNWDEELVKESAGKADALGATQVFA
ncbi:MAG: MBL fold metallo-hydrolase, partial [Verrucomicrobiota bacterium]